MWTSGHEDDHDDDEEEEKVLMERVDAKMLPGL